MTCADYINGTIWGTVASTVFCLGIFISYVPQQITIVSRQSTEGINPYYLLLMNLGSTFAFANILILSQPILSCCLGSISPFNCFANLQGALQLMTGFLGPTILLILAVRFREPGPPGQALIKSAKFMSIVDTFVLIMVILTYCYGSGLRNQLATVFGLAALAVGMVQYFPQIATTYRLKHTGSLSITMMLLQIPGGYIWCLSLALRDDSHWSTWISLFAAASFQLILLIMAIYYNSSHSSRLAARMATPPPQLPPPRDLSDNLPRDLSSMSRDLARNLNASSTENAENTPLLPN